MQQLMTMIIAMNGGHMVYRLDTYGQMCEQTYILVQLLHSPAIVMSKQFFIKISNSHCKGSAKYYFFFLKCFNKNF